MWRDTARFIRCAKKSFEFAPPVQEYGLAVPGAPLTAEQGERFHLVRADESAEIVPQIQSLDELAELPRGDGSAGTVACLNILQHVADPAAVAAEMIRILAPGGILLICSCTGGRAAANLDLLWRPAPHAFQRLLAPLEATLIGWQGRESDPHSLYAVGCKAPVAPKYLAGVNQFLKMFRQALSQEERAVSWVERAREWIARLSGRSTGGRARPDYYHSQFVMHAPVDGQLPHELFADCLQLDGTGSRLDLSR